MSKSRNRKNKKNQSKGIMNTNNLLFSYIKPRNNDMFSKMSGIDLQELLYYIENYYLELRNSLGFEDYITFGLELEFEEAVRDCIADKLDEYHLDDTWRLKHDGSLNKGAEISSPILIDKNDAWNNLKKVCSIVNENAIIGTNSGGHIHIGTQVIGDKIDSWLNFIKLWSVYENIIYRFGYGDFLNARPNMNKYAEPMSKEFWNDYQELKNYIISDYDICDIISTISHKRTQAVNFNNVRDFNNISNRNTIEFRCPNSTLESAIWQNNVNLFVNILLYSKSSSYNDDVIEKRKEINGEKYANLCWYGEVYLQQALELCDMLFTNNFDKVYFLRQYLKSFEIEDKGFSKSRPFTKKL